MYLALIPVVLLLRNKGTELKQLVSLKKTSSYDYCIPLHIAVIANAGTIIGGCLTMSRDVLLETREIVEAYLECGLFMLKSQKMWSPIKR
jgi:hypothetical protein